MVMFTCSWWQFGCKAKETIQDIASSALEDLANSLSSAFAKALTELSTFWVDIPTVNLSTAAGARAFVQSSTFWMTTALVILSIIVAGIKTIAERRNEPAMELVKSLLTMVIIGGVSVSAVQLLVDISDEFSSWIVTRATVNSDLVLLVNPLAGSQGAAGAAADAVVVTSPAVSSIPIAVIIVGGIVGVLASLVQMGLMILRGAMLILLTGILPLAAAMTNTSWGKEWLTKAVGWLAAFLLYKPAAAIIYSTAIILLDSESAFSALDGIMRYAMALMTIGMGVFALPALIKFIMPATAALGASGGGGMGFGAMMGAGYMMSSMNSAPSGAVASDTAGQAAASSASGASGAASASAGAGAGAAAAAGPLGVAAEIGMKAGRKLKEGVQTEVESAGAGGASPSGSRRLGESGGPSGAGEAGPTGASEARDE